MRDAVTPAGQWALPATASHRGTCRSELADERKARRRSRGAELHLCQSVLVC
jgi:hypothetical protein